MTPHLLRFVNRSPLHEPKNRKGSSTIPITNLRAFYLNTSHRAPPPTNNQAASSFDPHPREEFRALAQHLLGPPRPVHKHTLGRSAPRALQGTAPLRHRFRDARRRPSGFPPGHSLPRRLPATRATTATHNPAGARHDLKRRSPQLLHPPRVSHLRQSARLRFETTIAAAPSSTARFASSAISTPFTMIGPFHKSRIN